MIEFMLQMHETHTCLEVMQKMEKWMAEHQKVISDQPLSIIYVQEEVVYQNTHDRGFMLLKVDPSMV